MSWIYQTRQLTLLFDGFSFEALAVEIDLKQTFVGRCQRPDLQATPFLSGYLQEPSLRAVKVSNEANRFKRSSSSLPGYDDVVDSSHSERSSLGSWWL